MSDLSLSLNWNSGVSAHPSAFTGSPQEVHMQSCWPLGRSVYINISYGCYGYETAVSLLVPSFFCRHRSLSQSTWRRVISAPVHRVGSLRSSRSSAGSAQPSCCSPLEEVILKRHPMVFKKSVCVLRSFAQPSPQGCRESESSYLKTLKPCGGAQARSGTVASGDPPSLSRLSRDGHNPWNVLILVVLSLVSPVVVTVRLCVAYLISSFWQLIFWAYGRH